MSFVMFHLVYSQVEKKEQWLLYQRPNSLNYPAFEKLNECRSQVSFAGHLAEVGPLLVTSPRLEQPRY